MRPVKIFGLVTFDQLPYSNDRFTAWVQVKEGSFYLLSARELLDRKLYLTEATFPQLWFDVKNVTKRLKFDEYTKDLLERSLSDALSRKLREFMYLYKIRIENELRFLTVREEAFFKEFEMAHHSDNTPSHKNLGLKHEGRGDAGPEDTQRNATVSSTNETTSESWPSTEPEMGVSISGSDSNSTTQGMIGTTNSPGTTDDTSDSSERAETRTPQEDSRTTEVDLGDKGNDPGTQEEDSGGAGEDSESLKQYSEDDAEDDSDEDLENPQKDPEGANEGREAAGRPRRNRKSPRNKDGREPRAEGSKTTVPRDSRKAPRRESSRTGAEKGKGGSRRRPGQSEKSKRDPGSRGKQSEEALVNSEREPEFAPKENLAFRGDPELSEKYSGTARNNLGGNKTGSGASQNELERSENNSGISRKDRARSGIDDRDSERPGNAPKDSERTDSDLEENPDDLQGDSGRPDENIGGSRKDLAGEKGGRAPDGDDDDRADADIDSKNVEEEAKGIKRYDEGAVPGSSKNGSESERSEKVPGDKEEDKSKAGENSQGETGTVKQDLGNSTEIAESSAGIPENTSTYSSVGGASETSNSTGPPNSGTTSNPGDPVGNGTIAPTPSEGQSVGPGADSMGELGMVSTDRSSTDTGTENTTEAPSNGTPPSVAADNLPSTGTMSQVLVDSGPATDGASKNGILMTDNDVVTPPTLNGRSLSFGATLCTVMQDSSKKRSGITCLKLVLTVVNAVVLLCEIVLVGSVIYLTASEKTTLVDSFGQNTYEISFGAVIGVGVMVILITLLGAVGAINENAFLLKIYSTLMLIFLIGEVGTLAYTATQIEATSKYTEMALYESLKVYNSSKVVTRAWDVFQRKNECCGMRPSSNSMVAPHLAFARANMTSLVPESCCLPDLPKINMQKCLGGSRNFIHKADCYVVLKERLSQSYSVIAGIGAVKIVITASALILSVVVLLSV
ncbi:dentin sialophosphoprotein-like [Galendromus occidentalis]|uniref:Dentin sialophosphoprotein-like n=1 Tax=Galendromus occidentalis TaxID=34638 RepID=A0AAJ7SI57_9ACAR|nr:dentin sialophosphoprotein-like [Galendromus occidentalis]